MSRTFSSIRSKLIAAFCTLLVIVAMMAGMSFYGASQLAVATQNFSDNLLPSVQLAGKMRGDILNARISLGNHVAALEGADMDEQEQTFAQRAAIVDEDLSLYGNLVSSSEEQALLESVTKSWGEVVAKAPQLLEVARIV